jgi:6-phosphogluconolactonase
MNLPILTLLAAWHTVAADPIVFIGTYTKPPSEGIYAFRLDEATGHLTALGLAAKVANPSFVAIHPNGKFLYAVTEASAGAVTAFSIDRSSGRLGELNRASTKGDGPCHLSVDPGGHFLIAVNYGSGSTVRIPLEADGRLGEPGAFVQHAKPEAVAGWDPERQKGPHAHSVNFSPDGRFAFVADLGRDEVITYQVDQGGLAPAGVTRIAAGSGPRHFAFHPSGKTAYVINELRSTVTVLSYEAKLGAFKERQTISTLPAGFTGTSNTAEVQVHPSGKFLYGSNRGHDSITIFKIAPDGQLTFVGTEPTRGTWPRNFGIDPTGKFLIAANQNSNTIAVFKIDLNTGKLSAIGDTIPVGSPVCVRFLK